MSSNSRLTALLAALAHSRYRGIRRRLRQQRQQHHRRAAAEVAAKRSRSAPTSPIRPFEEFGKTKTEFKGFDVELVEAIAEKIGRTPEFKDTSFDTIFRDLAQGKFDMVASATTITDEREETVDFTNPYYLPSAQSILVKKGDSDLENGQGPRRPDRRRPAGDHR